MSLDVPDAAHMAFRRGIIAEYHDARQHHDTPAEALDCLIDRMIRHLFTMIVNGSGVPHSLLIMLGECAQWWELAHDGKPLPEELL
jgi:hypothetical protein